MVLVQSSDDFGTLLARYREARHLSQSALAKHADYTRAYICLLEKGRRVPNRDTITILIGAFARHNQASMLTDDECQRLYAAAQNARAHNHTASVPFLATPPSPVPTWPLVGREAEIALIEEQLASQRAPLLLFHGEPGIGKTRLLTAANSCGQAARWIVLNGACHYDSRDDPYAPFMEIMSDYLATLPFTQQHALLRQYPLIAHLLHDTNKQTIFSAETASFHLRRLYLEMQRFLAAIVRRSAATGVLLLLDDLQWGSDATFALLLALMRSRMLPPLRVVGTYRSHEQLPDAHLAMIIAELDRAHMLIDAAVAPLSSIHAHALAAALLPDVAPGVALTVVQRSAGIPFRLVAYAQALNAGASVTTIPPAIRKHILRRVSTLSHSGAQEVLELVAIGGMVTLEALLALSYNQDDDVIATLEQICGIQLFQETPQAEYSFADDLIREVIVQEMYRGRQLLLRRKLAAVPEQYPSRGATRNHPQDLV